MTPSRTREVVEELVRNLSVDGRLVTVDRDAVEEIESALHAAEERGRVAGRREALEEAAKPSHAVAKDIALRVLPFGAPTLRELLALEVESALIAARRAALEEAAKVAEAQGERKSFTLIQWVPREIAAAIRSLIGGAK